MLLKKILKGFADLTGFNPQSMFNEPEVNKRKLSKTPDNFKNITKMCVPNIKLIIISIFFGPPIWLLIKGEKQVTTKEFYFLNCIR
jgi:hypothetical protein